MLRSATLAALGLAASATSWAPPPLGPLWSRGADAVLVSACTPSPEHEASCRGLEVRHGSRRERLGEGYITVRKLWSRPGGAAGPDVLVLGDPGGSAGAADVIAVSFSPDVSVRKLDGARLDEVKVRSAVPLRIEVPFVLGFFNGAPVAGDVTVPLPMRWADGDFRIDLPALEARPFPPGDLAFRTLAARNELGAWAQDADAATRLFPPEARSGTPTTAYAVLEPMLAGHVEAARAILHAAWPRRSGDLSRPMVGEADFWRALCSAVVHSPQWRAGLDRLPQADSVAAAARPWTTDRNERGTNHHRISDAR